nr:transient receptor potential cation channel subfamily M member-like 2 [Crassostrea gigas]
MTRKNKTLDDDWTLESALEEEKNEKKEEENEKEEGERKRKKACTKEDSNIGISDILLWAVIFNRRELAEICWHKGKDKLLIGLVCSAILKTLSKKASESKEDVLADALEEHSKIFEQRCAFILDETDDEDIDRASTVLITRSSVWNICSNPVTFALENSIYDVFAHTCYKKYVKKHMHDPIKIKICSRVNEIISPHGIFLLETCFRLWSLLLFSYFVLKDTRTEYNVEGSMPIMEYYIYLWRFGDFIAEVLQCSKILSDESCSRKRPSLKKYIFNLWNALDCLSYSTLLLAFFLRQIEELQIARNMFGLSMLLIYIRIYDNFLFIPATGTTIIMVKEMLKDLGSFLFFVVYLMIGVGMYYHANLWPDDQKFIESKSSILRIFSLPYWQIFGEVDLELLTGSNQDNCSNNRSIWETDSSIDRCPKEDMTVEVVAGLYMMFTNLLLVNIVIAKFSYTFNRINTDFDKLYHFHLYTIMDEYSTRIPPPFNLVVLPIYLVWKFCGKKKVNPSTSIEKKTKIYLDTFQKTASLENNWKTTAIATSVHSQLNRRN